MLLEKKCIDCIWSCVSINEKRKKIYAFTESYYMNSVAIVVLADSPYQTQRDLIGRTAGILNGYMATEKITKYGIKVKPFDGVLQILPAVAKKTGVDAAIMNMPYARYYMRQSLGMFRLIESDFGQYPFGVAFRHDDTARADRLSSAIRAMINDGFVQGLHRKWFG